MTIKTVRLWLWVAVAALGITAATAALLLRPSAQGGFGGGHYSLLDQRGQSVDGTLLSGHPSMLFFGFTHCPEVCPTTLAEMASWYEALGAEAGDLRAYFVTIDPERDTPAIIADYVAFVSDRVTGLTGDPAEIAKMARAWGVHYEKVPLEGADYTMDHTASVYLINARGEFEGTIAYREDGATALAKLRKLLAGA
ncbi:SCO family protein [uncultured Devosia sp.]|uniref:SCO family protein n=1 Tax=uncultured Devosia sp. TaxID=211434 RepID=UPI0035C9E881